jgi:hypothetical protein
MDPLPSDMQLSRSRALSLPQAQPLQDQQGDVVKLLTGFGEALEQLASVLSVSPMDLIVLKY